jgi:hypothetical protein
MVNLLVEGVPGTAFAAFIISVRNCKFMLENLKGLKMPFINAKGEANRQNPIQLQTDFNHRWGQEFSNY